MTTEIYLKQQTECYSCGSTNTCVKPNGKQTWYPNYDDTGNVLCKKCCDWIYRQYNKKKKQTSDRAYYRTHKESILQSNRLRYQKNKERYLQKQHEYIMSNRIKILQRKHQYYLANKEKFRIVGMKRRAVLRKELCQYFKLHHEDAQERLFSILGARCSCGITDKRCLQFDHIDGGGNIDTKTRRFYANNPEIAKATLQTLCANCNWLKLVQTGNKTASNHPVYDRWVSRLYDALFQILGAKCISCACMDRRVLQFDHIDGGGKREREQFGNQRSMLIYYRNNPEIARQKLQVLCVNCNRIKVIEKREVKGNAKAE